MKRVQIRSFTGAHLPVFISDTGKYRPQKTPYLDTFREVKAEENPFRTILINYLITVSIKIHGKLKLKF